MPLRASVSRLVKLSELGDHPSDMYRYTTPNNIYLINILIGIFEKLISKKNDNKKETKKPKTKHKALFLFAFLKNPNNKMQVKNSKKKYKN